MEEIYHPHKPSNCYDVMGAEKGGTLQMALAVSQLTDKTNEDF